MTGASDGLAGPLGFGETHHGAANEIAPGQGDWQFLSISHKFHACCHGLHAMLEALRGATTAPEAIAAIEIRTHPRWLTVCNIAAPATGLETKFSFAHTAALSLSGHDTGDVGVFTDALAADPALTALRQKVSVRADEALSETQSTVLIEDGQGHTEHLHHDLSAPIPLDQRADKLRRKASALLGEPRAEALWQATRGDSLAEFSAQLVRS